MATAVLRTHTGDERARIAADMTDAVVAALLHGATFTDLRADLYSFLTVTYGLTISADDCADLAQELIGLTTPPAERW